MWVPAAQARPAQVQQLERRRRERTASLVAAADRASGAQPQQQRQARWVHPLVRAGKLQAVANFMQQLLAAHLPQIASGQIMFALFTLQAESPGRSLARTAHPSTRSYLLCCRRSSLGHSPARTAVRARRRAGGATTFPRQATCNEEEHATDAGFLQVWLASCRLQHGLTRHFCHSQPLQGTLCNACGIWLKRHGALRCAALRCAMLCHAVPCRAVPFHAVLP